MSKNIVIAFPGGVVTREQQAAFHDMERRIMSAITDAKSAGVPQGLIVALIQGHAYQQTAIMVESGEDA